MPTKELAHQDRDLVYQMYMNGAHNGDQMIQSGVEWWMKRTSADLDQWAAIHGTDPDTLHAVLVKARAVERRSGASNAAEDIWRFLIGLVNDDR
jgi:hypothetical protein